MIISSISGKKNRYTPHLLQKEERVCHVLIIKHNVHALAKAIPLLRGKEIISLF